MHAPPKGPRAALALVPLLLAFPLIACGGDEDASADETTPTAEATDFPAAEGATIAELGQEAEPSDLVAAPTVQVGLERGENRYGFGLFTASREPVTDLAAAVYAESGKTGEVLGPFPAEGAFLETDAAYASLTTTGDPDAATHLYTADVNVPTEGEWRFYVMLRDADGALSLTRAIGMPPTVGGREGAAIPDVGDPAPKIHTPTVEDVGGDVARIDTRQPPSTQHEVDFADVLGKEPIVLSFATPALCSSRVCGPVVDIAEQAKSERPDDANFIHMEIWEDNDVNKGPREQVLDYGLPTEPWLFVIGSDGKIVERIEGAYSADELDAALDEVS